MAEGSPGEASAPTARPVQPRGRHGVGSRRNPTVVVLAAGLVVVLVVIAVVWWGRRDSRGERTREDAGLGSLTAAQAEATRDYLAGDGEALLDLAAFGERVTILVEGDDAVADDCGGLSDDWSSLTNGVGDEGLIGLLGPLPDPSLGRLWATQITLLTEAMVLCEQDLGLGATDHLQQVAAMQEPVDLRLADLGVEP